MSWLPHRIVHRPYCSLLGTFVLWKAFLLLLAVLAPGPGYDTSTTLAQWSSSGPDGPIPALLRRISIKLTRWDAIYFTEAARRGYLFEQEWAFSYAVNRLINFVTNGVQHICAFDYEFGESLVSIAVSHGAHAMSVLFLHRLACTILPGMQGRRLAFIAACLHIISPAGLFMSAPNAESIYSLLSFTGALLFAQSFGSSGGSTGTQDGLLVLAGIVCGLATSVRGNGLLNGLLFLEEAFGISYSLTQCFTFDKFRRLFAVSLGGICTGLGFVLPQYLAYREFCVDYTSTHVGAPRVWCNRALPSIYSFVQDHYWNNGFLRYWTLSNVPLFALASPMLVILTYSAFWSLDAESDLNRTSMALKEQVESRPQLAGRLLRSLAASQIILTVQVFLCNHVQIITRLSSGYPVWYIWVAALLVRKYPVGTSRDEQTRDKGKDWYANAIVQYMVIYGIVQGALFASFLPPA
ncbi:GPI mannosyltransferase 2 [Aspergillus heteromorphus CBS 117.55]|uniref:GPI mannosyltransferase 2 n=1 Tax=Aspergillus heteromorphus CBS 117.55 TaxID=1448321 RepID=A0A317VT52_9EURO|nr:GPI mannosyltransferase 2 [Aspergillus heteromorphus CBS 117.55]PWY77544.1 GPI mannosyltransferase 2 [Aspergillus heteromorphus CBS 117.55]